MTTATVKQACLAIDKAAEGWSIPAVSLGYCCVAGEAQCRAKTCQLSWYEQVLCDGSLAKWITKTGLAVKNWVF